MEVEIENSFMSPLCEFIEINVDFAAIPSRSFLSHQT